MISLIKNIFRKIFQNYVSNILFLAWHACCNERTKRIARFATEAAASPELTVRRILKVSMKLNVLTAAVILAGSSAAAAAPGSNAAVLRKSAKTRQVSSAAKRGSDWAPSNWAARSTVASVSARAVRANTCAATAVTKTTATTTASESPSGI